MTLLINSIWCMDFDFKLEQIIMCWIIRNFEYYYVVGPAEMKGSKTQLQDLVDKGFTRLNVFL